MEQSVAAKLEEFLRGQSPAEEGGYGALNPETGCASQGETVEEALANN